MRNYTKYFCALVWRDDVPGNAAVLMNFAFTEEDAATALDGFNVPPFDAPPFHLQPVFPVYMKLNKANLGAITNAAQSLFFVSDGQTIFNDTKYYDLSETPRDSWNSLDPDFDELGDESATGYESRPEKPVSTKEAGNVIVTLAQQLSIISNLLS